MSVSQFKRREFITLLGGTAVTWPLTVRAQQPDRIRLIGVLMAFAESDPAAQSQVAAFRGALAKLGWTEGRNLRIELRWGAGDANRISTFARELVELRPDAIVGQTTPVTSALARETRTIPIVFAVVSDPIGSGFAASFAHPGGNITGFTTNEPAVGGKWMELLKEIAPRTARVGLLFNPATAVAPKLFISSIQAAASPLAVEVSAAPVHAKDEIEGVITAQARNPGGSLVVMPDAFFFNVPTRDLVIALAAGNGVPTIYFDRLFVESGGLIAYSADFSEELRQAAGYIDRILKGAKLTDLPIQQPIKYELVINLKAAKSLGLNVPDRLLAVADQVIE
jgi:putative tryptophan/tyrosine transport system substrate-binding protein